MPLEKTYKATIIKGLSWSTLSKLSRQAIQLIFIFILSRILSPAEYGIMAMITAFSMLAEIVRDMGTGSAIIHSNREENDLYNTAFCFNIVIGIFVFLVFYFTAPLIASFFRQDKLVSFVRVFSVIYLIGSLNIVQEAILQKKLEFKRLFFIDVISVTVSGIVALILALNNFGVWSLVTQQIVMIAVGTIILWITSSWKPKLRFKWAYLKEIKIYSMTLFANNVVYFFGRETDKFLIGKYMGAQALGIYHRAYMLMLLPVNQINLVISRVMFPVFSSMKNDTESMRKIYLKSVGMIAFFTFPMMFLMFVLAEPLILIVLGKKWIQVAGFLQIFIIYSVIESVGVTTAWIYKSLGHTKVMLQWAVFGAAVIVISAVIGMQWGARGIAISYVIAQLTILWLPGWSLAFKFIDLKVTTVLKKLLPVFLNALAVAALAFIISYFSKNFLSPLLLIIIVLAVCLPVYLFLSSVTKQPGVVIMGNFLRQNLRRFAKSA